MPAGRALNMTVTPARVCRSFLSSFISYLYRRRVGCHSVLRCGALSGFARSFQGQTEISSITRTSILAMWLVGMSPRAVRSGEAK